MNHPILPGGVLAALALVAGTAAADIPQAEVAWAKPIATERGRYLGWPTVTQLKDGALVAVFSGNRMNHVCPSGVVQMVRSDDLGRTWSDPVTIGNTPLDDRDAGICQLPDGEIFVSWFNSTVFRTRSNWARYAKDDRRPLEELKKLEGQWCVRSRDGGRTWTAPERLSLRGSSPHGPIVLKDGALLSVGTHEVGPKKISKVVCERSGDGGRTWTVLCASIPSAPGEGAASYYYAEPHVAELSDGTLVTLVRTRNRDELPRRARSKDGGRTWTPLSPVPLKTGEVPVFLRTLPGDRLLAVYGIRDMKSRKAVGEFAAVSDDAGLTWSPVDAMPLYRSPDATFLGDMGYTSTAVLGDGSFCTVAYEPAARGELPSIVGVRWRFGEPLPEERYLARRELKEHLARKADTVPYRFRFEKPADAPAPEPFESRYRVDGDTVWFWGDDSGPDGLWDWGDNRGREPMKRNGTLFAVELFAERELGMKFVWAGANGTVCRRVHTLRLPAKSEGRYVSTLLKARIRNYPTYMEIPWEKLSDRLPYELYHKSPRATTFAQRDIWRKRNRLQDRALFTYGHAFTKWKDRFEKTHPEYLNLHIDPKTGKGERGWTSSAGRDRTKLCVSNEAVVDRILADWMASGTNGFINVCENDSAHWCECAACRALDAPKPGERDLAHVSDRYVNFWNRLARKARAIRPDVMITSYVYDAYRFPPRRERIAFGDNMLFGFVANENEDCLGLVKAWCAAGMKRFFLRPNYFHQTVTIHRGLERHFFNQFRELLGLGMVGCDYDANDDRLATSLEYYVMARAFADPAVPFDAIVDDYCSAYGAAADEVKAYYAAVREIGERNRDTLQRRLIDIDQYPKPRVELPRLQEFGRTEEELAAKRDLIAAAVSRHAARGDLDGDERARLENLLLQTEHAVLTFRFLSAVEEAPWEDLKARADALNDFRYRHRFDLPDVHANIYDRWTGERCYWRHFNRRRP